MDSEFYNNCSCSWTALSIQLKQDMCFRWWGTGVYVQQNPILLQEVVLYCPIPFSFSWRLTICCAHWIPFLLKNEFLTYNSVLHTETHISLEFRLSSHNCPEGLLDFGIPLTQHLELSSSSVSGHDTSFIASRQHVHTCAVPTSAARWAMALRGNDGRSLTVTLAKVLV